MRHGVYSREEPTSVIGVVESASALPFVVGTAPVHTVPGDQSINELVKISSWQDVLDTFGYVHDFGRYTLMEFLYCHFRVFGYGPVVAVNVFDPATLAGPAVDEDVTLEAGVGTVEVAGLVLQSVTDDEIGTVTYVEGTDYTLSYDTDGYPIITRIDTGAIPADNSIIWVHYLAAAADRCGVDAAAVVTALAEIDDAFAQFGVVPSLICAPGYSHDPAVNAVMVGYAEEFGGGWYAQALCDVDCSGAGADVSSEVAAWKATNGFTSPHQDLCWPLVTIGDDVYHLSTILAGVLAQVDHANGDIPYVTGSNYAIPISGAQDSAGNDIWLSDTVANDDLNAFGVTTALNFGTRGWVIWGNRTAAYPGSTDPKDVWRNYRRMLIWLKNTSRLTLNQKIDQPGNLRQIESIVNSLNIYLNGLAAAGALIGQPKVEFRRSDNPVTELIDGRYTIRCSITPPTPMEVIEEIWQIDVSQFDSLFGGTS